MASQVNLLTDYNGLKCTQPDFLQNRSIDFITEEKMVCDNEDKYGSDPEFDVNPDLTFREIQR